MKKNFLAVVLLGSAMLFALDSVQSFAQGVIKISVTDKVSGEALEVANVKVENGGIIAGTGITDEKGNLTLKNLSPGTYNVKTILTGHKNNELTGVLVKSNQTTYLEVQLSPSDNMLGDVEIMEFKNPIIDGNLSVKPVFTHDEIMASPLQSPEDLLSTVPTAVQMHDGQTPHFGGSRDGSVQYIIDGMPVTGTHGVPTNSIQQMSVILGGIPAQYGDVTGAVIEIETRSGLVR